MMPGISDILKENKQKLKIKMGGRYELCTKRELILTFATIFKQKPDHTCLNV